VALSSAPEAARPESVSIEYNPLFAGV